MLDPDARDISTAMGVDLPPTTRFAWEEMVRRNMPDYLMEITLQQFIMKVFRFHPDLEFFQIVYKSDILGGEPAVYRLIIAERSPWGGVNIKDNLTPSWPLSLQMAIEDVAGGFKPENTYYHEKRHEDKPGVARFTAEIYPLGHTGHSFKDVGGMLGLDKKAPPRDFQTSLTSTELAKMTELVADCRQEGSGKGLETLQAIASLVCDKELFPDLDDL